MTSLKEFNSYGEILEKFFIFKTSPLAVKMIVSESDIPKNAYRPKRDDGYHYSQCQAFALSRREKKTVAMLKEDNWCPAPITAFGLDERPERPDMVPGKPMGYYCFKPGKYIGILTAPLRDATYTPDVVLMYPNPHQLRVLLLALSPEEIENLKSHFFPPSCTYAVVNPMMTGHCWIVLPDVGENFRALGDEGEMMFSMPASTMDGLISNLKKTEERLGRFSTGNTIMMPNFPQPEHYKNAFKMWGLDYDKSDKFR
jgi:uncharacterized protein (DUF169 family)